MRGIDIAVLFSVLLVAGVCGADSTREQSASPVSVAPVKERSSLVAYPRSQVDMGQEMGAKRIAEQSDDVSKSDVVSGSDELLESFSRSMEEAAIQESERDYQNRTDPFKLYQSQSQVWKMKRRERREKEAEQERRKAFERELDRERTIERDRIWMENEATAKNPTKLYDLPSTRYDAGGKAGELSVIEEQIYRAYAEQQGVTVEQVKEWVRKGTIGTSDVISRERARLFETP